MAGRGLEERGHGGADPQLQLEGAQSPQSPQSVNVSEVEDYCR